MTGGASRAAPDADAGRRIAITRHVIVRLFAFQQRGHLLDERKLGFVVETLDRMIGELEADRSGGPRRGVDRQMIDPVRRADPAVERGRIGLRTGDQARPAARSEELRVGKEWVNPCSTRWSPYP